MNKVITTLTLSLCLLFSVSIASDVNLSNIKKAEKSDKKEQVIAISFTNAKSEVNVKKEMPNIEKWRLEAKNKGIPQLRDLKIDESLIKIDESLFKIDMSNRQSGWYTITADYDSWPTESYWTVLMDYYGNGNLYYPCLGYDENEDCSASGLQWGGDCVDSYGYQAYECSTVTYFFEGLDYYIAAGDTYGDGGVSVSISGEAGPWASFDMPSAAPYDELGNLALQYSGSFRTPSAGPSGCTDSAACNYDSEAVNDDNSCVYTEDCEGTCGGSATEDCAGTCNGSAVEDDCGVCAGDGSSCSCESYDIAVGGGSYASERSWTMSDGTSTIASGGGIESLSICLEDGSYSVTLNDSYGDGWNGGSWTIGTADGQMYSFTLDGIADDGSTATYNFDLPGSTSTPGCMDMDSDNYSADATVDDGSCTPYPGADGTYWGCGEGTFIDCDSYYCIPGSWIGDGGCDDAYLACDAFACDGGDCANCAGECLGEDDEILCWDGTSQCDAADCPPECTDTTLTVILNDSYGDGWNGAELCIDGECVTLSSGSTATYEVCIDLEGANEVTCSAGSWPGEISWGVIDSEGNLIIEGGAPFAGCFGDGCPIYGCMDMNSENYNADANVDDGGCMMYAGGNAAYWFGTNFDGCMLDCSFGWCSWDDDLDGIGDSIGDGYCDIPDATDYGMDLSCLACDGGDCEDCAGDCLGGATEDCTGTCNGDTEVDDCGECGGDGCSCTANGDVNDDGVLNVADIVLLVGAILGESNMTCANVADANDDGELNVLDAILIVSIILGKVELADADYAKVIITHEGARFESNGFVGFELVLEHNASFDYTLPEAAIVKAANSDGTHMVVINDNNNILFNSKDEFKIVDVIAGNSSGKSVAVQIIDATRFGLSNAYPNPFNPSTTLELTVPEAGYVNVQVYNVMGQVVATLANGQMEANAYSLNWNAGSHASGLYFIKAECVGSVEVQKVMLMK